MPGETYFHHRNCRNCERVSIVSMVIQVYSARKKQRQGLQLMDGTSPLLHSVPPPRYAHAQVTARGRVPTERERGRSMYHRVGAIAARRLPDNFVRNRRECGFHLAVSELELGVGGDRDWVAAVVERAAKWRAVRRTPRARQRAADQAGACRQNKHAHSKIGPNIRPVPQAQLLHAW